MIAFLISLTAFALVSATMIFLGRRHKLTPVAAVLAGLGTLAVVIAAITVTVAAQLPGNTAPRGVTENQLPERVTDFQLPTI